MTFQLVRLIALPALLFTSSTLGCVAQGASAYDKVVFLDLARAYGVSRQPVQQALLLLRDRGLVREAPGRGLIVSPLDVGFVGNLYEVRAMLDGLAARLAAE